MGMKTVPGSEGQVPGEEAMKGTMEFMVSVMEATEEFWAEARYHEYTSSEAGMAALKRGVEEALWE